MPFGSNFKLLRFSTWYSQLLGHNSILQYAFLQRVKVVKAVNSGRYLQRSHFAAFGLFLLIQPSSCGASNLFLSRTQREEEKVATERAGVCVAGCAPSCLQ
jgi:hypothetical protein